MDMIIIGEDTCKYIDMLYTLRTSPSFVNLIQKWVNFSRYLRIPEEDIYTLREDKILNKRDYEDVIYEVLCRWRARIGTNATLDLLCKALESCELTDLSETLQLRFVGTLKNTQEAKFIYKPAIPSKPSYYVDRNITSRTRLSPEIFNVVEETTDVFLFTGLERYQISSLARGRRTNLSTRQIKQVSVRFILLEDDDHFDLLCKLTDSSVHWIEFRDQSYYWLKSQGSISLIQKFIHEEQTAIKEVEFVNNILGGFENAPVCITDSPGMGKTVLLCSLAHGVKTSYPDRLVIFLVFRELIQDHPGLGLDGDEFQIFEKILGQVGYDLERGGFSYFELFLDGFDEILPSQFDEAERLLVKLKKLKNTRIHVTTRPHMRQRLEEILGTLSYCIAPFVRSDQVEFLKSFWITEHGAKDTMELEEFAIHCLFKVRSKLTDLERDFAGIPLQCYLLADVYHVEAVTYSKKGNVLFELPFDITSIFDMYERMICTKFERAEEQNAVANMSNKWFFQKLWHKLTSHAYPKEEILKFHVHTAMGLVFPDFLETEPKCLNRTEPDLMQIYRVGLLELYSSSTPRFVHRTFAEYLLAEFLVNEMSTCVDCKSLLLSSVLGKCEKIDIYIRGLERNMAGFEFQYPVISYFVNCHLEKTKKNRAQTFSSNNGLLLHTIPKPYESITACSLNDLSNCFDLISQFGQYNFSKAELRNLILITTLKCHKHEILEKAVKFSLKISNTNKLIDFNSERLPAGYTSLTPLHVALERGSYGITEYLLNEYGDDADKITCMLHLCTTLSLIDKEEVIREKIQIIKHLCNRNKQVLEEKEPQDGRTPLLVRFLHPSIMSCFLDLGADVNVVDVNGNCVLHIVRFSSSLTALK